MFQSRERSDKISEKCISFERYEYSLFDSTPGYNQKQKSDKISKNAYLKYLHNYDLRFLSHHIMLYIVIIRKNQAKYRKMHSKIYKLCHGSL